MKRTNIYSMLLCAIIACACGGGGDEPVSEPTQTPKPTDNPNENPGGESTVSSFVVTFNPSLNAPTRATDTQFELNDRIGVFAVESSGNDNRSIIADYGNYAHNVLYTYDGNKFAATPGIETKEGYKLYYTAVYPYQSSCANNFKFEVRKDQSSGRAYTESDLCTASTDATDAKVVDLKFSHRLSKVVINLTGSGWTNSNISVRLKNMLTLATVNLNTLDITAEGVTSDVTCASNGSLSFKAIVPPQTIGQSEKLMTVTMNGVDYSLETQSTLDFRSGKQYEYTINMDENSEIVEFTGDINPWNVDERINSVVPEDIQEKMEPYIPIYHGSTPPNIEGCVYLHPFVAVYCEDNGYAPGEVISDYYLRFSNQNMIYNTIDIDELSISGNSSASGKGAFISGSGDNFTAFFNTVGTSWGISTRTALVISGTKTINGVANLRYAFVMVEKGDDPSHQLMNEGVFRVFKDDDDISEYVSWPGNNARSKTMTTRSMTILTPFNRSQE